MVFFGGENKTITCKRSVIFVIKEKQIRSICKMITIIIIIITFKKRLENLQLPVEQK